MTREEALKMRNAIHTLFSFSFDGRYDVAIKKRSECSDEEWEVHLFVREKRLSVSFNCALLINCALLSNSIERISRSFLASESEYDLSTSGEPYIVPSFKIW